eukprot:TRINITY_DN475_c0_g1_i2.p1 TRINITY_DN475_c0_g1~~TRINITY_DN475_c0_g1_i2.p1  ORF type:complete len:1836 (+),score=476.30 TRINITY_DN475_c0_g1_i2:47-5554(+)
MEISALRTRLAAYVAMFQYQNISVVEDAVHSILQLITEGTSKFVMDCADALREGLKYQSVVAEVCAAGLQDLVHRHVIDEAVLLNALLGSLEALPPHCSHVAAFCDRAVDLLILQKSDPHILSAHPHPFVQLVQRSPGLWSHLITSTLQRHPLHACLNAFEPLYRFLLINPQLHINTELAVARTALQDRLLRSAEIDGAAGAVAVLQMWLSLLPLHKLDGGSGSGGSGVTFADDAAHNIAWLCGVLAPRKLPQCDELTVLAMHRLLELAVERLEQQLSASMLIESLQNIVELLPRNTQAPHLPVMILFVTAQCAAGSDAVRLLSACQMLLEKRASGYFGSHGIDLFERHVVLPLCVHGALQLSVRPLSAKAGSPMQRQAHAVIQLATTLQQSALTSSTASSAISVPASPAFSSGHLSSLLLCMQVLARHVTSTSYISAMIQRTRETTFPAADRMPHIPNLATSVLPFLCGALIIHCDLPSAQLVFGAEGLIAELSKKSPLHAIGLLPSLLHRVNTEKDSAIVQRALSTLPLLCTNHLCVSPVIRSVVPMLYHPGLRAVGLNLLCDMFALQSRLLERLLKAIEELEPVIAQRNGTSQEIMDLEQARARVVLAVCTERPDRGAALNPLLTTMFASLLPQVVVCAVRCIQTLVQQDEIAFHNGWQSLSPLLDDMRSEVVVAVLEMCCCGTTVILDAESPLGRSVMSDVWRCAQNSSGAVRAQVFKTLKEYLQTSEQGLAIVSCTGAMNAARCADMLNETNPEALAAAHQLLSELLRQETEQHRSAVRSVLSTSAASAGQPATVFRTLPQLVQQCYDAGNATARAALSGALLNVCEPQQTAGSAGSAAVSANTVAARKSMTSGSTLSSPSSAMEKPSSPTLSQQSQQQQQQQRGGSKAGATALAAENKALARSAGMARQYYQRMLRVLLADVASQDWLTRLSCVSSWAVFMRRLMDSYIESAVADAVQSADDRDEQSIYSRVVPDIVGLIVPELSSTVPAVTENAAYALAGLVWTLPQHAHAQLPKLIDVLTAQLTSGLHEWARCAAALALGDVISAPVSASTMVRDACDAALQQLQQCARTSEQEWVRFGASAALGRCAAAQFRANTSATLVLQLRDQILASATKPQQSARSQDDIQWGLVGAGVALARVAGALVATDRVAMLKSLFELMSSLLPAHASDVSSASQTQVMIACAALPSLIGWGTLANALPKSACDAALSRLLLLCDAKTCSLSATLYTAACVSLCNSVRAVAVTCQVMSEQVSFDTVAAMLQQDVAPAQRPGILLGICSLLGAALLPTSRASAAAVDVFEKQNALKSYPPLLRMLDAAMRRDNESRILRHVSWGVGRLASRVVNPDDMESSAAGLISSGSGGTSGGLATLPAIMRLPEGTALRLVLERVVSDTASVALVSSTLQSLQTVSRVPPLDWPQLLVQWMRLDTDLAVVCMQFAVTHAAHPDSSVASSALLSFVQQLWEQASLAGLHTRVRCVLFGTLWKILPVLPAAQARAMLLNIVFPMLLSPTILSAEEREQLQHSLNQCGTQQPRPAALTAALSEASVTYLSQLFGLSQVVSQQYFATQCAQVWQAVDGVVVLLRSLPIPSLSSVLVLEKHGAHAVYLRAKLAVGAAMCTELLRDACLWLCSNGTTATPASPLSSPTVARQLSQSKLQSTTPFTSQQDLTAAALAVVVADALYAAGDSSRWLRDTVLSLPGSVTFAPRVLDLSSALAARVQSAAAFVLHSAQTAAELLQVNAASGTGAVLFAAVLPDVVARGLVSVMQWEAIVNALLSTLKQQQTSVTSDSDTAVPLKSVVYGVLCALRVHGTWAANSQDWLCMADAAL